MRGSPLLAGALSNRAAAAARVRREGRTCALAFNYPQMLLWAPDTTAAGLGAAGGGKSEGREWQEGGGRGKGN